MQYRRKLYRPLAATALMLLAGLVLAPTIVTAGFHASSKKIAEPAPQLALEAATRPANHSPARPHRDARPEPLPVEPQASPAARTEPQSETEAEPNHGQQHDYDGPTTFAVDDFAPAPHSFAAFPHGAVGIDVASNDAGGNITKITRKPKQPAQGKDSPTPEAGNQPGTSHDNEDDANKNKDGEQAAADTEHNTPPDTQYVGDHHNSRPQASVPEPSSIALLAAGLIGLIVARRRS